MPTPSESVPGDRASLRKPAAEEDVEEDINRMADEGGGVVDQHFPVKAPILRSDLVDAQGRTG
jgi:hypothetical protein